MEALHGLGAPCVGVHYTGRPLDKARFAGVRVLFSDLYLLASGNLKQQFVAIEALLRSYVDPSAGGPFVLVLWTSHEEQVDGLRAFLHERLAPANRPLAVLGLDKNLYLADGALAKPQELRAAISERVSASPQIRALISWEADVLAAAGATLAEVAELVPPAEREVGSWSEKLDGVLSRLAVAAVGRPNVPLDPRSAINTALAPILADRILSAGPRDGDDGVWNAAITQLQNLPEIDDQQVGRMNRMLHLSMPNVEKIGAKDWGAVLLLPESARTDEQMLAIFGVRYQELLSQVFYLEKADRGRCTPVLVRIGAVCDHAQRKSGPAPFVLGVLVPTDVKRRDAALLKSEFESPILTIDPERGPAKLFVNARFQISMVEPPADWTPLFRIRDQLLMTISAHVSEYVTRPGVVKLPL